MHTSPKIAGIYVTDNYFDVAVGLTSSSERHASADVGFELISWKRISFPKTSSNREFDAVEAMFDAAVKWIIETSGDVEKVGVGCCGPFQTLDYKLRENDRLDLGYGKILPSVHSDFEGRNIYKILRGAFERIGARQPDIQIQTDVEAAALGELYERHMKGRISSTEEEDHVIAFLKFSRGVGGGVAHGSSPWPGRTHAEMGQIRVERWPGVDEQTRADELAMEGVCQFHNDCLEGLASVPAFFARWGTDFFRLANDPSHIAWERQAFYAAQLCVAVTCLVTPSQIILGGRIMRVPGMVDRTRQAFKDMLGSGPYNPVFGYGELGKADFIDGYSKGADDEGSGLTGAMVIASFMSKSTITRL